MFRPKALLFDFDGTIVDTAQAICESFNQVLRNHSLPEFEHNRIRSLIGRPLIEMFRLAGFDGDSRRFEALVDEYRGYFLPVSLSFCRPLPGAAQVLARAKRNAMVAIVTSRKTDGAMHILTGLGLSSHVDLVVGIDDVVTPKPAAEPVRLALRRLGVSSEHAVMIGDTPDDVLAAKNAGVMSIGVLTGAHEQAALQDAGADCVLRDLTQLHHVIELGERQL
jgi:phosphoglycolate phosphatase